MATSCERNAHYVASIFDNADFDGFIMIIFSIIGAASLPYFDIKLFLSETINDLQEINEMREVETNAADYLEQLCNMGADCNSRVLINHINFVESLNSGRYEISERTEVLLDRSVRENVTILEYFNRHPSLSGHGICADTSRHYKAEKYRAERTFLAGILLWIPYDDNYLFLFGSLVKL